MLWSILGAAAGFRTDNAMIANRKEGSLSLRMHETELVHMGREGSAAFVAKIAALLHPMPRFSAAPYPGVGERTRADGSRAASLHVGSPIPSNHSAMSSSVASR